VKEEWPEVQTFTPTMEQFSSLKKLLAYMESCGAHKAGIAKIRPPDEWIARAQGYQVNEMDIKIEAPVMQTIAPTAHEGAFTANHSGMAGLTVEAYRKLATNPTYVTPPYETYDELEDMYWDKLIDETSVPPIYGADVCESITDKDQKIWNIKRLDSILTDEMEEQIPGVNMPYLYFGMWRATFSWHVEDMDLYGVNFLHFGAPKTWYCVPPQYGYKLEKAAQKLFPHMTAACHNLLRHKAVMLSPYLLEEHGVRVHKVVQEERDMIIVFPHAYHSGFNHGFNIAESTNFALPRWIEYGKRFRGCLCGDKDNAVVIHMEPFIRKYQPNRIDAWVNNHDWDFHPEDPPHLKRAYEDAMVLLDDDEEIKKFQDDLRLKRDIPKWYFDKFSFIQEDDNFPKYEDEIDLYKTYDISAYVTSIKKEPLVGPRARRLKLDLLENPDACRVQIKPIKKPSVFVHMKKRKLQLAYEETFVNAKPPKVELNNVSSGFAGANIDDMMAKKAMMSCSKNHRFRSCRKCKGCRTENCGDCVNCFDMPAFGGNGTMKQKCKMRMCINPIMQQCADCKWNIES